MRLRSKVPTVLDQAWERSRASARRSGIPDRFPIEVSHHLSKIGSTPFEPILETYSPGTPVAILAPKESGTTRPYTIVPPRDQILFQLLVDQCIGAIDAVLPPQDVVFQYRPQSRGPRTFHDTPTWGDFREHVRARLERDGGYVLEADIAGFFLHIRPNTVVKGLLAIGAPPDVCDDLETLLTHFEIHGVPGLPQGLDPSTAISNIVLKPIDDHLGTERIEYCRWSDDIRAFAPTYTQALRVQEILEERLLTIGFTLAAGKTFIRGAASALRRFENLEDSLNQVRDERLREAIAAASGRYDLEFDVVEELRESAELEAIEQLYQQTIAPVVDGAWSKDPLFRAKVRFLLSLLGQLGSGAAVAEAPTLVWRYPDLIGSVAGYLRGLATVDPVAVRPALPKLHAQAALGIDYQRLAVAAIATALARDGADPKLAALIASDASSAAANPILRRRAGMSAVALGPRDDGELAGNLWQAFANLPDPTLSRMYLVAGAAFLGRTTRGALFSRWSGESRAIDALIEVVESGYKFDYSEV